MRACREGRLDTGVIRAEDRERPEATAAMVAWSDAEIRAAGYRPRVLGTVRPDCAAIERTAVSLRQAFEERIRVGALPTWERLGAMEMFLGQATEACASGPSPGCAAAQAALSRQLAGR